PSMSIATQSTAESSSGQAADPGSSGRAGGTLTTTPARSLSLCCASHFCLFSAPIETRLPSYRAATLGRQDTIAEGRFLGDRALSFRSPTLRFALPMSSRLHSSEGVTYLPTQSLPALQKAPWRQLWPVV